MEDEITPSVLLRRHTELAELYDDGDDGRFLSGWQCENPWSREVIGRVQRARSAVDSSAYQSLNDDHDLRRHLIRFHREADGHEPQAVFCGEGASSIIFSFCASLKEHDVTEVFYLPPLYFALHFALRFFGIRARPISGKQAYEDGFTMNLPNTPAVLLLCDPVWYAGMPLPERIVAEIAVWQQRTSSWVFVDGSFQYMRWDCTVTETTARLDPDRTVRVLCPTKALALHGYRFAYATIPAASRAELVQLYTYIYASDSADNIAFARTAVDEMSDRRIVNSLARLAAKRHAEFRRRGIIESAWQPACGYFVFERLTVPVAGADVLMDGTFFEQRRYPDHRRINLLSPSIGVLG